MIAPAPDFRVVKPTRPEGAESYGIAHENRVAMSRGSTASEWRAFGLAVMSPVSSAKDSSIPARVGVWSVLASGALTR